MFLFWYGVVGIVDHFRVNACDAFVCCFFSISKHRVLQHFPCLALLAVMVDLNFCCRPRGEKLAPGVLQARLVRTILLQRSNAVVDYCLFLWCFLMQAMAKPAARHEASHKYTWPSSQEAMICSTVVLMKQDATPEAPEQCVEKACMFWG